MHAKDVIKSDKSHAKIGCVCASIGENVRSSVVCAMDGVVEAILAASVVGIASSATLKSIICT